MEERGTDKGYNEILLRYVIGAIVAVLMFVFSVFYLIFRPLTVLPAVFILKLFYDVSLNGLSSIIIADQEIVFIDACIAGSAFLLLFLFNILTREINFKKRILIFLFDCALLLVLNILRLIILIVLLVNGSVAFDIAHKVFWYVLSTIFVVAIWFCSVQLFRIKAVPFYSDIKFLVNLKKEKRKIV